MVVFSILFLFVELLYTSSTQSTTSVDHPPCYPRGAIEKANFSSVIFLNCFLHGWTCRGFICPHTSGEFWPVCSFVPLWGFLLFHMSFLYARVRSRYDVIGALKSKPVTTSLIFSDATISLDPRLRFCFLVITSWSRRLSQDHPLSHSNVQKIQRDVSWLISNEPEKFWTNIDMTRPSGGMGEIIVLH